MSTFDGAVDASEATVRQFLMENYRIGDEPMTAVEANALMAKHAEEVERGIRFASHAAYVGDNIADAEGLTYVGEDDDEEAEEDDE